MHLDPLAYLAFRAFHSVPSEYNWAGHMTQSIFLPGWTLCTSYWWYVNVKKYQYGHASNVQFYKIIILLLVTHALMCDLNLFCII